MMLGKIPSPAKKAPIDDVSDQLRFLALRSSFQAGSWIAPDRTAAIALKRFMTPERIPRPAWEEELAGSARRERLKNGLMSYRWGSGPKVLLVHGWEGRGTQMGKIALSLAHSGFEAIAIDLPAHGESPGDKTHAIEAKDAILEAGNEMGELEALIAHSFGACASIYALYHGLDTKKAVEIAGANRFTDIFDRYCTTIGVSGLARKRFEARIKRLVGVDPAVNYAGTWARAIDIPGLIIHDRDDKEAPFEDGLAIHEAWKTSRLFETQGLGHRRILKSPEVHNEILRFIRS